LSVELPRSPSQGLKDLKLKKTIVPKCKRTIIFKISNFAGIYTKNPSQVIENSINRNFRDFSGVRVDD
jgi:hypothetical protein